MSALNLSLLLDGLLETSTHNPSYFPLSLQLSFIVRIVPSPDWFLGVDSFDLCEGDQWKESVTLELYPYDAGTDSGFTFSSPNFETIPQDKVTQVNLKEPMVRHHVHTVGH